VVLWSCLNEVRGFVRGMSFLGTTLTRLFAQRGMNHGKRVVLTAIRAVNRHSEVYAMFLEYETSLFPR
jgi:hypothetical protein